MDSPPSSEAYPETYKDKDFFRATASSAHHGVAARRPLREAPLRNALLPHRRRLTDNWSPKPKFLIAEAAAYLHQATRRRNLSTTSRQLPQVGHGSSL